MAGVCAVQGLRLAAVLQQCTEQLAVLGHLLPEPAYSRTGALLGAVDRASTSSLTKLNRDWLAVLQQLCALQVELQQQSFSSVLQAVEEEERRKAELLAGSEQEAGVRNRQLQRERQELQRETAVRLQEEEEELLLLQQQVQRLQGLSQQERSFVRRSSELQVEQALRRSSQEEEGLHQLIQLLQGRLEEERRLHEQTQSFLKQQRTALQEQLEQQLEHTEQQLELKQQQLHNTSSCRSCSLELLQELSRKYREADLVVKEDRQEKERLRRRREREQTERRAATMLQAWWRGCLVRRGLGPFRKPKKAKEGKKKGKKKK